MTENYCPVLRLGAGAGRDFVVGDIHGMFHLLKQAMDQLRFDPSCDRLLCVGDLVDRGPYSSMVLEFLREPWVYAVPGNHEQMFLDCYQGGQLNAAALDFNVRRNGAAWWLTVPAETRNALLKSFARLPVAIEVATERGSVGIVHAEVPRGMDWPTFCHRLEQGDEHTRQSALWGRTRVHANDSSGVPGIDRLYSGHTIVGQVARLGNCYYLDTGAFLRTEEPQGSLSVANVMAASQVLLAPPRKKIGLVQLFEQVSPKLFGSYLGC